MAPETRNWGDFVVESWGVVRLPVVRCSPVKMCHSSRQQMSGPLPAIWSKRQVIDWRRQNRGLSAHFDRAGDDCTSIEYVIYYISLYRNVLKTDVCYYGVSSTVEPAITQKSPSPTVINEGDTTTLLCVASGNPKPSITWRKGSTIIPQNSNSNYTIASANKDHAGFYTCTAVVSAPGLTLNNAVYTVQVTVKCKYHTILYSPFNMQILK